MKILKIIILVACVGLLIKGWRSFNREILRGLGTIKDIEGFRKEISMQPTSVVIFFKPTCKYCHKASPMMEKLAKEYKGNKKIKFIKIDLSNPDMNEFISEYDIETVPTILIMNENNIIKRYDSNNPEERTFDNLNSHIKNSLEYSENNRA